MKKMIFLFALSALFASYGEYYVSEVGDVDVTTPAILWVDIIRKGETGGYTVLLPSETSGGSKSVRIGNFTVATKVFADVELAVDKLDEINERLFEFYLSDEVPLGTKGRLQSADKLMIVSQVISRNISYIQTKMSEKVAKSFEASKEYRRDELNCITEAIEDVQASSKKANESAESIKSQFYSRLSSIEAMSDAASTAVRDSQVRLAAIETQLKAGTASINDFNRQLAQVKADAISAGLSITARGEVMALVGTVGDSLARAIPSQVGSYSNQMSRLNTYLGFKDYTDGESGEEHKNLGIFTEPNKKGGGKAGSINEYLNSFGVIAYKAQPEEGAEGEGEESNPFQGFTETENNNVTASFKAPVNWADGVTIKCTNGVFSAEIPKVDDVTTPWHYSAKEGKWLRPYVFAGNQMITASGVNANSAGTYYVNVTCTGDGWSAAISKTQTENESTWSFWVGTLESVEVDGQLSVVSAGELGAMPIILCYE